MSRGRDDFMASASVKDVAALAQVSVGTVSNVLNRPDIVSPETVERVHLAMEKLSYVRNEAARQLRLGHSQAIGLISLSGANPFFTDVATAAENAASDAGYEVIVGNSDERSEREAGYLNLFEELRVRGVLLSPVGDVAPRLRRMRDRDIPVVLVDRESSDSTFSSVSVDDVAGGALAAQHLIRVGVRGQRDQGAATLIEHLPEPRDTRPALPLTIDRLVPGQPHDVALLRPDDMHQRIADRSGRAMNSRVELFVRQLGASINSPQVCPVIMLEQLD